MVPPKFYERLPESYQKRIAFFVEQINQEGIDKSVLSAVNQSKWYRKELLPKIDFYGFWDGIYLKALFDGKLSKDNVNRIWEESKTRDYTPIQDNLISFPLIIGMFTIHTRFYFSMFRRNRTRIYPLF